MFVKLLDSPRWKGRKGPNQVERAIPSATDYKNHPKVEGKWEWIHATRCQRDLNKGNRWLDWHDLSGQVTEVNVRCYIPGHHSTPLPDQQWEVVVFVVSQFNQYQTPGVNIAENMPNNNIKNRLWNTEKKIKGLTLKFETLVISVNPQPCCLTATSAVPVHLLK